MIRFIFALGVGAAVATPLDERPFVDRPANTVVISGERVNYADIDLSTRVGADRFLRRAQRAANTACGLSFTEPPELVMSPEQACVQGLLEPTVALLGSAALNELYMRKAQPFV